MFDKDYYEQKKQRLEQRLAQKKDIVIAQVTQILNQFYMEQSEILTDLQEVEAKFAEFSKQEEMQE